MHYNRVLIRLLQLCCKRGIKLCNPIMLQTSQFHDGEMQGVRLC